MTVLRLGRQLVLMEMWSFILKWAQLFPVMMDLTDVLHEQMSSA